MLVKRTLLAKAQADHQPKQPNWSNWLALLANKRCVHWTLPVDRQNGQPRFVAALAERLSAIHWTVDWTLSLLVAVLDE